MSCFAVARFMLAYSHIYRHPGSWGRCCSMQSILCRLHRRFGSVLILVGGLRYPYCAWAALLGVSFRRRRHRHRHYRYTHIQTTQSAAAHRRRAWPAYDSSWHLGDFNDPFCATTQLTLVLSTEKEIINRQSSPFMCLVVFWCCAVSVVPFIPMKFCETRMLATFAQVIICYFFACVENFVYYYYF